MAKWGVVLPLIWKHDFFLVKSNNSHNGYGHNGHYCVPPYSNGINNSTLCVTMKSSTGTDSRDCQPFDQQGYQHHR